MTPDAISDLIARGEGPTVEFKRSLTKDVGRELCAFANAGGGIILIGVSDAGEIVGHRVGQARTLGACDEPLRVGRGPS